LSSNPILKKKEKKVNTVLHLLFAKKIKKRESFVPWWGEVGTEV
jgi:hypothetical protein